MANKSALTPEQEGHVFALVADRRMTLVEAARLFGVHRNTITNILRRQKKMIKQEKGA